MILSELLSTQFNLILGNDYKVFPFHTFSQDYTKNSLNQYGNYDINYQAFEEMGNIIPCVLSANEIDIIATDYLARSYNYTLTFQVPIDTDKFNFFKDYQTLYNAVNNTELTLDTYKAFLTMSEPVYMGKENTGSYQRVIYQVRGVVSVRDSNVGVGSDYSVSLMIKNNESYTEHFFTNISDLTINSTTEANAVQLSNKAGTEQEAVAKSQSLTFSVPDIKFLTIGTVDVPEYLDLTLENLNAIGYKNVIIEFDTSFTDFSMTFDDFPTTNILVFTGGTGIRYRRPTADKLIYDFGITQENLYAEEWQVSSFDFSQPEVEAAIIESDGDGTFTELHAAAALIMKLRNPAYVATVYDEAVRVLFNKTIKNQELLSPNEELKSNQRKVKVKLYYKEELANEFYAILSTEYSAPNKTAFGTYRIGLANDEKGV